MEIQETNPADNYRTTTTSCDCPSRADQRPWEPCKHMVRLIVHEANVDADARIQDDTRWAQRRNSADRDRARRDRRELRYERDVA